MTTLEKVKEAEFRIRAVIAGAADNLTCPFCGHANGISPDTILCCEPLAEMVNAICNHVELKDQLKMVERVMDRLSSDRYELSKGPKLILN